MASEQVVSYVLRYGGRCRDCANEDGICPTNGMPCEPEVKRAVINHTLKALEYGISHGFIADPFTRPAPAATDTGLETKGFLYQTLTEKNGWASAYSLTDPAEGGLPYRSIEAVVTRSQAVELLAAKDKTIALAETTMIEMHQDLNKLEAKLAAAEKALEPFAEYCGDHFDKDYDGNPLPDEQKVGWVYLNYGHFRKARAVLGGKPS